MEAKGATTEGRRVKSQEPFNVHFQGRLPNQELFDKIPFEVRYNAEMLFVAKKLATKLFVPRVCEMLALFPSPSSVVVGNIEDERTKRKYAKGIYLCCKYLDMFSQQRPDWDLLEAKLHELGKYLQCMTFDQF